MVNFSGYTTHSHLLIAQFAIVSNYKGIYVDYAGEWQLAFIELNHIKICSVTNFEDDFWVSYAESVSVAGYSDWEYDSKKISEEGVEFRPSVQKAYSINWDISVVECGSENNL